jgi:peptidoglycan/xylan/chitin deacetylase (PgdA/CDA1 family)
VRETEPTAGHETDAKADEDQGTTQPRSPGVVVRAEAALKAGVAFAVGVGSWIRRRVAARRGMRVATALWAGTAVVVTSALVGWVVVQSVGATSVTVKVEGHRTVELSGPAPVRKVLRDAGVRLHIGVLRTASGRVLDPQWSHPVVFVNGREARSGQVVRSSSRIRVVPGRDSVEGAVVRVSTAGSSGGLPDVERDLWDPGSGGQVVEVVGARSGEVQHRFPLSGATPPAPLPGKTVALTFDDGPDPRNTPQLLQVLRASGVKATFCVIGFAARAHPELVSAIHADGHVLCDHTESHPYLDRIPGPAVEGQLASPAAYLAQLVGRGPAFVRAPYGALNPNVVAIAHRQGFRVLGWSVDPSDYLRPPAGTIASRVLSQVHPGAIILMHDGGGDRSNTVAALPMIIAALRSQGYAFTLPQVSDASSPPVAKLVTGVRVSPPTPRRPRAPRSRRESRPATPRPCSPPGAPSNRCLVSGP